MALLSIWTERTGYTFTNSGQPFPEQQAVNITLPVDPTVTGVTYSIISGELPGGLAIVGDHIVGSPFIVANVITYKFCIRATKGNDFADRTFNIQINGVNPPEFITPAGELAIGVHQQLYALDGTYVSYQIEAFDLDIVLGTNLKYFIASGDGHLPPGLTISNSGLISGYIIPSLILTPDSGTGDFDGSFYDKAGYDFATLPTDGFDSYDYDDVFFDYTSPRVLPRSLNANYQFKVTVSDGITYAQRIFKIFVVGSDQFRADSTTLDGFAGSFTSDSTFLRSPVWMTDANLGTYRANNYITVPIALYDKSLALFRLEITNCEIYAVTNKATLTDNIAGGYYLTVIDATSAPQYAQYFTFNNFVVGASDSVYQIQEVTDLGGNSYRLKLTSPLLINVPDLAGFYIGSLSQLPPGMAFDINGGELYGNVPYQPTITENFKFTITATRISVSDTESVSSYKTFNITILGDITSQITWNTDTYLGSIPASYPCLLSVNASSNIDNAVILYELQSGTLPPGLTLTSDGEIVGSVNQYENIMADLLGITTFDGGNLSFDHSQTTIDRRFTFTVIAYDQYQYSANPKEFTIDVTTPNSVPYSNITTRPFLTPTQRILWKSFINNTDIFVPNSIYRANDSNFGLQNTLTMLVYAGIQTEEAAKYIGAIGLNFKRKRFKFGSVEKAVAIDPTTGAEVYEVIYVQMIDPMESNGKHLPLQIKTYSTETSSITVDNSKSIWAIDINTLEIDAPSAKRPEPIITVDSTGYEASNPKIDTYFPNSITNWQSRLSTVGITERNYLPLWMRSIPAGQKEQLGYILAVPLCFCKPGTADNILLNIEFSGFNFNDLDYTVDRLTISAVTGYSSDKYLIFRDDRITV
jgi:hypothetical protein